MVSNFDIYVGNLPLCQLMLMDALQSFKEIRKYIMPPCPSYLGNIQKISAVVVVLFLTLDILPH